MRGRLIPLLALCTMLLTACGADGATTDGATDSGEGEPRVERDLVFMTRRDDGATLTLDIHIPDDPTDAPILIGEGTGGFLADNGVMVFDIDDNDHLGRESDPDGPEEIVNVGMSRPEAYECALRYARTRASELGNDAPTVVLTSFSYSGAIAVHVGLLGDTLTERWNQYGAAGGAPREFDCEETRGSTHVDIVIGQATPCDITVPIIDGTYGRAYQQEHNPQMQEFLASAVGANPDLRVRLIHGKADHIPIEEAEDFAAAMREAGYDVEVISWSAGHSPAATYLLRSTLMDLLAD